MKKETIKAILGLTQQEIAMILNVTRSQYSHYERNTRGLTSAAGLRLDEMMLYMLSPMTEAFQKEMETAYDDKETKQQLSKQIRKNEFQLLVLSRKISAVEEKLEKHKKAVRLMGFLNSAEEAKKTKSPKILGPIKSRAGSNFNKSKSELILLKVEQESLQMKHECYQKALQKLETL